VPELDLLERGLKALAYLPGHDYHGATDIHALMDRLAAIPRGTDLAAPAALRETVTAPQT
jgi:hypothetical protein